MVNPLLQKLMKQIFMEWAVAEHSPFDKILNQVLQDNRAGSSERKMCQDTLYKLIRFLPLFELLPMKPQDPAWGRQLVEAFKKCAELELLQLQQMHLDAKITFEKDPLKHLEKLHGVPKFILTALAPAQLEPFHNTLHAMMNEAPLSLRCNTLKCQPQSLLAELRVFGAAPSTWLKEAVYFNKRQNLQQNLAFQEGLFEIQDEHSQVVALLCDLKPEYKVLDLCAGGGGKTLHMAALMQGQGEIWATDISANKIQNLRQRTRRANASNVRTFEVHKRPPVLFDRILVDAPCSSMGTLRRNPDRLYKITEKELKTLQITQRELLVRASSMLKPGGKLIYSTCSFLPQENQVQMAGLLELNKNLRVQNLEQAVLNNDHIKNANNFLTAIKESPPYRLALNSPFFRSEFLQFGPSQTSGGLIGDAFFISLVELS